MSEHVTKNISVPELKVIHKFRNGKQWIEITDDEVARIATKLSQTAIKDFYQAEFEIGKAHNHRWFFLMEKTNDDFGVLINNERYYAPVCLAVLPQDSITTEFELNQIGCHITGYRNSNPLPERIADINLLSSLTGIDIVYNFCGRPLKDQDGKFIEIPATRVSHNKP